MTVIRPYYLPELRCTPDHGVYATTDSARPPEKIKANKLTPQHFLAVPRRSAFSNPFADNASTVPVEMPIIDVGEALRGGTAEYKTPHRLPAETVAHIMAASAAGATSRALGLELGKDASYIRHVRSKVQRGLWNDARPTRLVIDEARRAKRKYLITLEAAISTDQLEQMKEANIQLVVIRQLLPTYRPPDGYRILTVSELVAEALERQRRIPT